ncbi:heat shock protein HtpX [Parelusimicrobium proximum]|uniref:M48 family metalloprotease n=1 Tax=Parelusimicrobium proximum TaxID=3228953 RepID=UPI003D16AE8D
MANAYGHISRNRFLSFILLLLFILPMVPISYFAVRATETYMHETRDSYYDGKNVLGAFLGIRDKDYHPDRGVEGKRYDMLNVLAFALTLSLLVLAFAYFNGEMFMLNSISAIKIDKRKNPEVHRAVETMAIRMGLTRTPVVYMMPSGAMNAFAVGWSENHMSVVLTVGLVERLSKSELEAVIAHEIAHIINGDTFIMTFTVCGIAFFRFVGQGIILSVRRNKNILKSALIPLAVFCLAYGYLFAPLIRFALSRRREMLADATSALMTRYPLALAEALRKIKGQSYFSNIEVPSVMSPLFIDTPLNAKESVFDLFSGLTGTHPPIEERIDALVEMDAGL